MSRRFLILSVLAVLPAAHSFYWFYAAHQLKQQAQANIAALNQRFVASHSGTRLEMAYAEAIHWPLPPRLRLQGFEIIQDSANLDEYRFHANSIEVAETSEGQYELRLPTAFTASESRPGAAAHRFSFSVEPLPQVFLRTPAAAAADTPPLPSIAGQAPPTSVDASLPPTIVYQFSTRLPQKLRLTVSHNGKENAADFNLPSVPLLQWQAIPPGLSRPADIFFSMLEEIADKAK